MPTGSPSRDVSEVSESDFAILTAAASALAVALTHLREGDALSAKERRRHGGALLGGIFIHVARCDHILTQLNVDRSAGGLSTSLRFAALVRVRQGVNELRDALKPLPPSAKFPYPHQDMNRDWVRALPGASILAVQQGAAMLRELFSAPATGQGTGNAPQPSTQKLTALQEAAKQLREEKLSNGERRSFGKVADELNKKGFKKRSGKAHDYASAKAAYHRASAKT